MSSEFFEVTSSRDSCFATATFEKGYLNNYKEENWSAKDTPTGTCVTFKPDTEVFKDMTEGFSYNRICAEIKNISYLNKGVHFKIVDIQSGKEQEFYSENGIADFIADSAEKSLMSKPIVISKSDETDEMEIAFLWTGGPYKEYVFVNGLYCSEGGSPVTGAKTTITTSMKKYLGKNIDAEVIRKGLVIAINCKVAEPSFSNQTKSRINNPSLRTLASLAFKEGLEEFSKSPDFNTVADIIKRYDKAEKAADRAREAVLIHNKEMINLNKNKLEFITKLNDAERLGPDATLYIAEGSSASGALLSGRRTKTEGVLEIKGKMLNTFKAPEERIVKNEEIKLLLYALGQTLYNFNEKKLRYGRIGIAADGDADGFAIALLILTVLRTICPEILDQNRVYRLYSPLYIEHDKNGTPVNWWYSDDEYNLARSKVKGDVARIKGWGSLTDKDLAVTIFSDQGRLDQIISSPEGIQTLEELMGPDVQFRKDYVFNNIDFSTYGEII